MRLAEFHLPAPIAIDGPAASGKSTLGAALAVRFGYRFLDTGLMYRAFTLAALRAQVPAEDAKCASFSSTLNLTLRPRDWDTRVLIDSEDVTDLLRDPQVEANVSRYSALPPVRGQMVDQQREFAAGAPAILAGRDIGTVVLPNAPLKFYLEASEEARASRRSTQASQWGHAQAPAQAHTDIVTRDVADSTRKASPLRRAKDAIVIDTTDISLEQVIAIAIERVACFAV
ncbi:MAG: (d)CMP kinase [Anaerolineaceae bacterium]